MHSHLAMNSDCASNSVFSDIGFHNLGVGSARTVLPSDRRNFTPIVRNVTHKATRIDMGRGKCSICRAAIPPNPFAVSSVGSTTGNNSLRMAVGRTSNDVRALCIPCSSIPILRHTKCAHCTLTVKRCHDKGGLRDSPGFVRNDLVRKLRKG